MTFPPPPPAHPPAQRAAEPAVPRTYPQLLRGPGHRWWRPLLSLMVMVGFVLALVVVAVLAMFAALLAGVDPDLFSDQDALLAQADQPWFLLANNLLLGAFIPLSMLAIWIGHGWRPRWVTSVVGGMRWRWLLVTSAVALVVQVVATLALFSFDGFPSGTGVNVGWLLAVVFLTTPLQAAGEEYLFRGWLTQSVGSWIPAALVSALVTAALASTLFAMAHGSQNVWLFLDRFAFGVLASYLTWRTGGLEAAIGAHTVNNVVVFVPTILTGGMASALSVTDVPAWLVLADVAAMVVIGALVVFLARRTGIQRVYVPEPPPPLPWRDGPPLLVPPRSLG